MGDSVFIKKILKKERKEKDILISTPAIIYTVNNDVPCQLGPRDSTVL